MLFIKRSVVNQNKVLHQDNWAPQKVDTLDNLATINLVPECTSGIKYFNDVDEYHIIACGFAFRDDG